MNKHKFNGYIGIKSNEVDTKGRLLIILFHWSLRIRFYRYYESSVNKHYQWTWKHLPLMLRSTELNTFDMTNTIYRDLVCRANG